MQLVTTSRCSANPSVHSNNALPATRLRRPRQGAAGDPRRRKPAINNGRYARPSEPAAARLEQIEDALIGSLLDAHPNRNGALDRLLHEFDGLGRDGRPGVRLPMCVSASANAPARLLRVEQLLVAAVIGRHPKQPESLDHLLQDLNAE